jgi:thiosulfate reductase cytochrome b subunit
MIEGNKRGVGSNPKEERSASVDQATAKKENQKNTNELGMIQEAHAAERSVARRSSAKAHLFVTICHWTMVALLAISLFSGMRLGWGYEESPLGGREGFWGTLLGSLSPKGTLFGINLVDLHVYSAFLVLLVAGVYVGYLVRSGATRRLSVKGETFQKLVTGLRSGNFLRNKAALWSVNLLIHWVAFLFIALLTLTGVALYRVDLGLYTVLGGYDTSRLLHGLIAYLLIPYTIIHALLQWWFGQFWSIFKAHIWWPHIRAGMVALSICTPIVVAIYFVNSIPTTLTVPQLSGNLSAPILDGDASDPIWANANPVIIRNVKGANDPEYVDVSVKAVHDGQYVYFQFQWADPDVSAKRYPLLKTEDGWKVLQTAFDRSDEDVFYEDKLAMYITSVPNGSCASTCHLGVGPASEKNEKHGLHYTTGEVGDLWHWKSVRTEPMGELIGEPGFVDDQYFGPATPLPTNPKERYTGGYYADPNEGGGYAHNFVKLDPDKPLSETYVVPQFLPPPQLVYTNADPATSEVGQTWWIHKSQAISYTVEADTYPVGSIIPNIVISPLTGDRSDIRAKAQWRDGRWTLETRRLLDTGSDKDVAFVLGKPVYISVATYNRTQTHHGMHMTPVRVMLQP